MKNTCVTVFIQDEASWMHICDGEGDQRKCGTMKNEKLRHIEKALFNSLVEVRKKLEEPSFPINC